MDERQEFDKNYKINKNKIYRMIARYISDVATIEDLTQNTFVKAWLGRESFRGDSSYYTWLCSIAINTAIDYIAKHKPRLHSFSCDRLKEDMDTYPAESFDTLDNLVIDEQVAIIWAAIEKLPRKLHDPLVLFAIYELSYEQIADSMGIPVGTVRSRIHRARFELKQLLA